jgi:hypothetical protein
MWLQPSESPAHTSKPNLGLNPPEDNQIGSDNNIPQFLHPSIFAAASADTRPFDWQKRAQSATFGGTEIGERKSGIETAAAAYEKVDCRAIFIVRNTGSWSKVRSS